MWLGQEVLKCALVKKIQKRLINYKGVVMYVRYVLL